MSTSPSEFYGLKTIKSENQFESSTALVCLFEQLCLLARQPDPFSLPGAILSRVVINDEDVSDDHDSEEVR